MKGKRPKKELALRYNTFLHLVTNKLSPSGRWTIVEENSGLAVDKEVWDRGVSSLRCEDIAFEDGRAISG